MNAKNYLRQVEKIDISIECKLVEQQMWRDIATGITANMEGERVQSSGSQSKMADAVGRCVDMEAEIDRLVDILIDTKKEVIQTIEQVQNPTWYKVLHMKYIRYMDLLAIADEFNASYDWAKSAHSKALKIVQQILDERK